MADPRDPQHNANRLRPRMPATSIRSQARIGGNGFSVKPDCADRHNRGDHGRAITGLVKTRMQIPQY
jgi:hypothetical protein